MNIYSYVSFIIYSYREKVNGLLNKIRIWLIKRMILKISIDSHVIFMVYNYIKGGNLRTGEYKSESTRTYCK